MLPKIANQLIVTKLDEELLVYNTKTEKATCLSSVGMRVFQACQGELSEEQLDVELRSLGSNDVAATIEETIVALREEGVLAAHEAATSGFDRRRFLAAAGAAAAMPVVLSALAPRPAYALSCVNCDLNLVTNTPLDCTDCGKKCPPGASCANITTCNFEYVYNPANDGAGNPCQSEGSGIFRCRATGGVFAPSCNTVRGTVIGSAIGTRYYCCVCTGALSIFTC